MEPEKNNDDSNLESTQSTHNTESSPLEEEQNRSTDNSARTPKEEAAVGGEADNAQDNSQYQTYAILGYILPFLFFLPLLDDKTKNVPYVRFHANQQLILLVLILAVYVLHSFLFSVLMMLGYYLAQLLNLVILALIVVGAFNAYNGKMKELPVVGKFRILK